MGLEHVEFFLKVEAEFGLTLSREEERTLRTMADVYRCIARYQTGIAPELAPPPDDERWRRLASILEAFPGVRPEHVRWETDLYKDLALGG